MVAGVECGGAGLHQQLLHRPAVGGGVAPSPPLLIQGTKVRTIYKQLLHLKARNINGLHSFTMAANFNFV